ncbi:hypothetical protein Taro_005929, partial [Colocasia esculenta]|nr:hypothetical protein [Colocasia esculenta]
KSDGEFPHDRRAFVRSYYFRSSPRWSPSRRARGKLRAGAFPGSRFGVGGMYRSGGAVATRGGTPTDTGDGVVTLDQVPRWIDAEQRSSPACEGQEDPSLPFSYFPDPLTVPPGGEWEFGGAASRFPVDHEINSKIYLWRGNPWSLEVDAVVNSTNESLDEAHSSPGLHAASGPGLAEECATLGGCRTGMAKITNAYDLPAR